MGGENLDPSKTSDPRQVPISGDDIVRTGFQSAFEKHVVRRIFTNDVNPASGNHHDSPSRVLEQNQE